MRKGIFHLMVFALCLMAVGCAPAGLWKYPRAEVPEESPGPPELLEITLPSHGDQTLRDAMDLLTAKAKDISGGRLLLEISFAEDPLELYQSGEREAVMLSDVMVSQLEPALDCLELPFLYPSREDFLTALGDGEGPVKNGRFSQSLLGEVLAVYYGGTAGILSRNNLYLDEVGLESVGTLGFWEGESPEGQALMRHLGVQNLDLGSSQEQQERFSGKQLRAMEFFLDSETIPQEAKYFYYTRHRTRTFWLLLREDASLSEEGREYLRQATAYTIQSQNQARAALEESRADGLSQMGIEVLRIGMPDVFEDAGKYAAENYRAMGFVPELWQQMLPAMQG